MGTSLCSASPVSEPNLPPDSTNQPTFLLPNLIRHPTELFSFNFLSQKNIQNLRSKMASRCRQNYHEECEASINKQINMELFASYSYTALASHFARDDVHLKGFAKFFKESSDEEREHADKFMSYQTLRGGRVVLQPINRPAADEWETPLAAMEYVLKLEKEVNQALFEIHALASTHNDPHLTKFLEDNYLEEQAESIHKIAGYITQLHRVGDGLGVHLFDKDLQ